MSIIKNGQISLFCHFNKIIKGSSFQSPALNQKHFRNVCQTAHQYLTKFSFDSTQDSKEISISVTSAKLCSSAYDYVTDLEICGFHKNNNLDISRTKHFFFYKKFISYTSGANLLQQIVLQQRLPSKYTVCFAYSVLLRSGQ